MPRRIISYPLETRVRWKKLEITSKLYDFLWNEIRNLHRDHTQNKLAYFLSDELDLTNWLYKHDDNFYILSTREVEITEEGVKWD